MTHVNSQIFFVEGFKMLDHKMHTDMEVEIKLY